ncbi:MAG TPA: hypothetical protein VN461_14340 [Vicinamibacteria bacterium]|jgi:uncharacterized protein with PQ loop repeat|nr:hypothetical protein [Vicinamibacteria bacterium]
MPPDPGTLRGHAPGADSVLSRLLGGLSVFTMLMTVPQVLTIWIGHQAAGVSTLSWSAYLLSAVLWLWYGLQKRDRNIYLPCVGWIMLDGAVIAGAVLYG